MNVAATRSCDNVYGQAGGNVSRFVVVPGGATQQLVASCWTAQADAGAAMFEEMK